MQQQDKVAKLIDWFAKAALRHAEAIEAMQEEAAAVQVECLDRFYAALQREGEDALDRFLVLLEHKNHAVAGMAAVYGMRQAPDRCTAVLAKLAEMPGLIGFRARYALERWESGDWPR